jgi:hypothetical protein
MDCQVPEFTRHIYKNKFYHSGDLGDLMYSLSTIKALGGGTLVLSQDYNGMEIREPMTATKIEQVKKLLQTQDYIVSVEHAPTKPADIDYDLNNARQPFIDWGNGKLSPEEIKVLRFATLTSHYEHLVDIKDTDKQPYYIPKSKLVLPNKPIVINRTARYNNPLFPWQQIMDDYRSKIIYVGLPAEYAEFSKQYGSVDYHICNNYTNIMEVIAGAKLFIGNQSFPYAIAESMKQNCIQETDTWVGNCQFYRHNAYISKNGEKYDYTDIKKFIELYI